jgi:hypothetical protein
MIQEEFAKIFERSAAQRLLLVKDIWSSSAENPDKEEKND